ncbi:DoxX family protein [soil metagenome]
MQTISHAKPSPYLTTHAALRRLVATSDDKTALFLRLVFAAVLFPHGAQHALGWFGGFGFAGTHGWMTGTLGIPAPLAALAIVTELVAPVLLLVGLGGRAAAAGLGVLLAVAATTHASNGFFRNWSGKQAGEGFEYHLLGVALAVAVVLRGSGALSIDRVWTLRDEARS